MKRTSVLSVLGLLILGALVGLSVSMYRGCWEFATTLATLLVGFIAAYVVIWQGYLLKQQIAFSAYLDLDKEWNSREMIEHRKNVHPPRSDQWDDSHLEATLEFFEKLASMFMLSGDMPFLYQSTLGWYAAHYFLFAREHGRIEHLRALWKEDLYSDLEELYAFYIKSEVRRTRKTQREWESERLSMEDKFWEQEQKD